MAIKQRLKFLRISLLLFLPIVINAQTWKRGKEISLDKTPTSYAADYQGNFFLGFSDGSLTKYNPKGELLENFSLSNNSSISLIDVQNNLKPFLFYFDNQQVIILDRFASVPKKYELIDFGVQFGMIACPSPDGDIWVAENNPQRLKKINPNRKSTVLEVQINIGDTLLKMQAYQNLLFVGHKQGLYVFDQYGGKLYVFSLPELVTFQLIQDRVFLFSNQSIIEIKAITGEKMNEYDLPKKEFNGVIKTPNDFVMLNNRKLTYYNFTE